MRRLLLCFLACGFVFLSGGCSNSSLDKTLVVPNTMSALIEKDADFAVPVKLELILSDDVEYDVNKEHEVLVEYMIGSESYRVKPLFKAVNEYAGYRYLTIQYEVDNININNSKYVNVYLDGEKIVNETKLIKSSIKNNFVAPKYEATVTDGQSYEKINVDNKTNEITYAEIKRTNLKAFIGNDSKKSKIIDYYFDDRYIMVDDELNYKSKEGFSDYSLYMYIVIETEGKTYLKNIIHTANSRPWERFMDDYVEYLEKVNESK